MKRLSENRLVFFANIVLSTVFGNGLIMGLHGFTLVWALATLTADLCFWTGVLVVLDYRHILRWFTTLFTGIWRGLTWFLSGMASLWSFHRPEVGYDALEPPRLGDLAKSIDPNRALLPISPYTGHPYDPAWFGQGTGGQSNRALLALMKSIEREIEERKDAHAHDGLVPEGIVTLNQVLLAVGEEPVKGGDTVSMGVPKNEIEPYTPQAEYEQTQAMYPEESR